MPEIEIRPATEEDIPALVTLDHNYSSDFVWQMEIQAEEDRVAVNFREIHLPRSVRVEYPRPVASLAHNWAERSGLLAAVHSGAPVGYISLNLNIAPATAWVTDLVVLRRLRRQGIGSALVLAAQEWSLQHGGRRMVVEMQPKNFPMIRLAQKLGFDFCGYNDWYYINHDIGLFFAKSLR